MANKPLEEHAIIDPGAQLPENEIDEEEELDSKLEVLEDPYNAGWDDDPIWH